MKTLWFRLSIVVLATFVFAGCQSNENAPYAAAADPVRQVAFNGDNLEGWREPRGAWEVVGRIALNAQDPKRFTFEPGQGVLVNGRGGPTANLVSSFTSPELSLPSGCRASKANVIVNARVATDPRDLEALVREEIDAACQAHGAQHRVETLQSFRPGRPVPTHRM